MCVCVCVCVCDADQSVLDAPRAHDVIDDDEDDVCVRAHACVCVCVRACVRVYMCVRACVCSMFVQCERVHDLIGFDRVARQVAGVQLDLTVGIQVAQSCC